MIAEAQNVVREEFAAHAPTTLTAVTSSASSAPTRSRPLALVSDSLPDGCQARSDLMSKDLG